jgi:8-hydroxy-5-deazaflavin:NADPH oxidoreductase
VLSDPEISSVDTDILVLGESEHRDATDLVRALADAIPGMRGVYAGRLRNAHQVEALTANLIAINRRYQVHAGLRVTDL